MYRWHSVSYKENFKFRTFILIFRCVFLVALAGHARNFSHSVLFTLWNFILFSFLLSFIRLIEFVGDFSFLCVRQTRFSIWHWLVCQCLAIHATKNTFCCLSCFVRIFFVFVVCFAFMWNWKKKICWNFVGCCLFYFFGSSIVTIRRKDTSFKHFIKKRDEIRKFNKRLSFISAFNIQHITT